MTIEEKLKQIIGEQTFAVVALQTRVEELTAENEKLRDQVAPRTLKPKKEANEPTPGL